ncbi:hypothetical protein DIQ79_11765 [Mycolicibacterium smegmatis]|uniref:Uncharacterized protein n=1 Tax=Mycolicibacterium smegmatis (strain ATCC 700084 / mc(2)155) TaxID=246196 RepID=A0QQZ6_MYCS2|nr:hypothetical protein MSMEG_0931 [Mycolicibacterium smegmatis MC2 155]TBM42119.1 hypothetical protein DIQ86_21495 [Mycolicibacterium smegmatis]TBH46346.1 hypothetical protein EYS45_10290 [Mycolicibacterium smegmatis MC2 155]TBM51718.1 hypothetical protein DIQ85_11755 [Mycolicibacterium smegmatis]TBM62715.1 hypothetical protein DIQ83_12695 [Mycolicibacterium smegmatis]
MQQSRLRQTGTGRRQRPGGASRTARGATDGGGEGGRGDDCGGHAIGPHWLSAGGFEATPGDSAGREKASGRSQARQCAQQQHAHCAKQRWDFRVT